jgi:hypothetical protein
MLFLIRHFPYSLTLHVQPDDSVSLTSIVSALPVPSSFFAAPRLDECHKLLN